MAGEPRTYYRNYDSSDTTQNIADSSSNAIKTLEAVGFSVKEGCVFKEWNTAKNGTGDSFQPGEYDSLTRPQLYAQWEEIATVINYIATSSDLTLIADAIRTKGGTSASLVFPSEFVSAINAITTQGTYQSKYVSPTESQQVVTPSSGYDALSSVTVGAISSNYVGSNIPTRTSANLSASGSIVTAAAGYYAAAASKAVAAGTATTPATSITTTPTITVSSTGLITATVSSSKSITPTVSAGYISSGTAGTVTASGSNTNQLSTQAAATITPIESSQTAVAVGKYTTGTVTVAAISSNYVGSNIATRSAADLTASGSKIMAPAGYYAASVSKAIAAGSATTPATTISVTPTISVSSSGLITASASGSKSITPSVSAGYVSSGTAGTVSVSGSNTQQLTVYNGAHHTIAAGYTVTITLTNPINASAFPSDWGVRVYSFTGYDEAGNPSYAPEDLIGTILSPTDSITVTVPTSATGIDISYGGLGGCGTATCTGNITQVTGSGMFWDTEVYEVSGDGTIVVNNINWDEYD